MAAFEPFQPHTGATSGKTVAIATGASGTSVSGTVDSTGSFAPSMMVANIGGNTAWIRMSTEATPTATQADTPIPPNTVLLFANPSPSGKLGIAVVVSVTTSANTVYFTPGEGGGGP